MNPPGWRSKSQICRRSGSTGSAGCLNRLTRRRRLRSHSDSASDTHAATHDSLFGWYILVMKRTLGALLGYSSVKSTSSLKVPPSQGLSSGLRSDMCHMSRQRDGRCETQQHGMHCGVMGHAPPQHAHCSTYWQLSPRRVKITSIPLSPSHHAGTVECRVVPSSSHPPSPKERSCAISAGLVSSHAVCEGGGASGG